MHNVLILLLKLRSALYLGHSIPHWLVFLQRIFLILINCVKNIISRLIALKTNDSLNFAKVIFTTYPAYLKYFNKEIKALNSLITEYNSNDQVKQTVSMFILTSVASIIIRLCLISLQNYNNSCKPLFLWVIFVIAFSNTSSSPKILTVFFALVTAV